MSSRSFALAVLLAILAPALFAAPPKVAVGDFKVTSDNPRLKYVGKGLSEMFSAQLSQSKAVLVVERERREALLGELEFAMSGLADEASAAEAGKLLSVDYLVFGEIVDMDSAILVSLRMLKVETGEVAWSDKNLGKLSDYDAITRKLAASALKGLGAQGAAVAAVKPAPAASEERKIEAIVAFSGAVNAVDKKDSKEAKRQIELAKAIDPDNAAVAAYAARLIGSSPRYLVELLAAKPAYNPAALALQDKMTVYSWFSATNPTGSDLLTYGEMTFKPTTDVNDQITTKETKNIARVGVQLPLGERWGLSAEALLNYTETRIEPHTDPSSAPTWHYLNPGHTGVNTVDIGGTAIGGDIGLGYRLLPGLGLGIAVGAVNQGGPPAQQFSNFQSFEDFFPGSIGVYWFASAGIAYRSSDGALSADLEAVWSPVWPSFYVLGPVDGRYSATGATLVKTSQPLDLSANLGYGFFGQRLIANLGATAELFNDSRGLIAARADPSLEFRPFKWLALRGGYEYSFVAISTGSYKGGPASASGSGFMGGATLSLWGFDLSFNYLSSYRPLHDLPGAAHQYRSYLMGLSYSGLVERK